MKQVIVTPHRIRPLEGEDDVQRCAEIMVISEPWVTLGRTREVALKLLSDPSREISVAADPESGELFGFVIVLMQGAFVGYIQTVAVAAQCRGRGIGSLLIAHAESRIFRNPRTSSCASRRSIIRHERCTNDWAMQKSASCTTTSFVVIPSS